MQELSEEWQVSRTYIYQQKDQVLDYIRTLDGAAEGCPCVSLDDRFVKWAVISLSLECHAPESGIQQFFRSVLGMKAQTMRYSRGTAPFLPGSTWAPLIYTFLKNLETGQLT